MRTINGVALEAWARVLGVRDDDEARRVLRVFATQTTEAADAVMQLRAQLRDAPGEQVVEHLYPAGTHLVFATRALEEVAAAFARHERGAG